MKKSILTSAVHGMVGLGKLKGHLIIGSLPNDAIQPSLEEVGYFDTSIVTIAPDETGTFIPELGISKQDLKTFLKTLDVQSSLAEKFLLRAPISLCTFEDPAFKDEGGGFSATITISMRPA